MGAPCFERLVVIGLGLVGGSVALGARARGLAGEVRGVDIHRTEADPIPLVSLTEAAGWADGIVISVPPAALEGVLAELGPKLRPDALLTDTASVKGPVARAARRHLPRPEQCVGAHPIAGGDRSGFEHADPNLFENAACIVTPEGSETASTVDRIEQFWQGLGTFTARKRPAEHDALMAKLSHSPHAIAFAFARGLPGKDELGLSGGGLRDFTRIARANPVLWSEILWMNRECVEYELGRFEKNLGEIRDALGRGDRKALERALAAGKAAVDPLDR